MKTDLPCRLTVRSQNCLLCLSVGLLSPPPLCFNIAILSKEVSLLSEYTLGLPLGKFLKFTKRHSAERVCCVIVHFKVPFINFAKQVDVAYSVSPQFDLLFSSE